MQSIISSTLLISVPTMAIPQLPTEYTEPRSLDSHFLLNGTGPTYDQLIAYVEQIENDEFDHMNPLEIDWLKSLMIQLAQAGLLEEDGKEVNSMLILKNSKQKAPLTRLPIRLMEGS